MSCLIAKRCLQFDLSIVNIYFRYIIFIMGGLCYDIMYILHCNKVNIFFVHIIIFVSFYCGAPLKSVLLKVYPSIICPQRALENPAIFLVENKPTQ